LCQAIQESKAIFLLLQEERPMPQQPSLNFAQIQAAMQAMITRAMQTPAEPVAMAIVDATGNLLAYNTMDNLRLYSRRHALRKAYTAAILGLDTGAHAQRLHSQGRSISEMGDPHLTFGQGGLVIMQDGVILGGIGVGGYPSGQRDEDLARVGLQAMHG
jgi:uncharacterized protein GlcG (DUF336 family)